MSAADVSLSPTAVTQPTSFELVCAQAAIVIVVVLYRPGSEAVQQKFFVRRTLHSLLGKTTKTAATRAALFDSNMDQIVCRLEPLAVFRGPTSKGMGRDMRERSGGGSLSFAVGTHTHTPS